MLERYWPDAAQVNACIKNEAETADVAVLLAVHQPSPLVCRNVGTSIEAPATERDILDAFLTKNVPGGTLLLPITGPSGVGKSHMIRWLDAQLQRSEHRDRLHIIRIPKSASLKTVVERILEPLANDPKYDRARENLTRAVGDVNAQTAAVTFRAELENVLNAKRSEMEVELREHPERRHLKPLIGHARELPRLFTDSALAQHFMDTVISRIISRAVRGRTLEETPIEDESLSHFTAEDLRIPRTLDLNRAAQDVRSYYLRNLQIDTERLKSVVDLLNDAVDPAIAKVFRLEENTGGPTLQDIILAVREILMRDGKELILLIEDFKALAGIQEVLLNVCIQEGEYEGKQVRATMRTALALTDGFLTFRETILTRAQREWVVGGLPQTDNDLKEGVVNMVGLYLNAARWGDTELKRLFLTRRSDGALADWLPVWRDNELDEKGAEEIGAFGLSGRHHPLFPFNRQAIEYLTERHLRESGVLKFNPRRVINEILRNTLLMRPAFEARNFPPDQFQEGRPNFFLANWVRQTNQTEVVRRRLGTFLSIWGANPKDATEISHVPPAIFTAFGMPTPSEVANIHFVEQARLPPPSKEGDLKPEPATPAADPIVETWTAKLDAWASGTELSQTEARGLRTALMSMVRDAINWNSLRIQETDLDARWIVLPNARSNPQTGRQLKVCEDSSDPDGLVRAGLLGVIRYQNRAKQWDYPEAADDYVASAAIIDHLVAQLIPHLIADAKAQAVALASALITQARIAGLGPPVRGANTDALLAALFATPPPSGTEGVEENWDKIRSSALGLIGSKSVRTLLQEEFFSRVASFQSTGRKPYAIDIARVLEVVGSTQSESPPAGLSDDAKTFLRSLSESRLWTQLQPIINKLRTFQANLSDYIDEGFNKVQFVTDLQEVIRLLPLTGTGPTVPSLREYSRSLQEFQASPLVDLVKNADMIVREADRGKVPLLLNALGKLDLGLIQRTLKFLADTNSLISAAETNAARERATRNQIDPLVAVEEITHLLTSVASPASPETEVVE